MTKQNWPRSKKHIDEEARAAKLRARERVSDLVDSGDLEAFITLMKRTYPKISADELQQKIELFHELKQLGMLRVGFAWGAGNQCGS